MVVVTLSLCYLAPDGTERRVSNWKSILDNTAIGSRVARCFFYAKNTNLGIFWTKLDRKRLVYLMVIWNILLPFSRYMY
jgi:hypothetical protein